MKLNTQEIIAGGVMLAIGLASVWRAFTYVDPMAKEYPTLTTTFVPILWGGLLAFLSIVYLIGKIYRRKREIGQVEAGGADTAESQAGEDIAEGHAGVEQSHAAEESGRQGTVGAEPVSETESPAGSRDTVTRNAPPMWVAIVGTAALLLLYVWSLKKVHFAAVSILLLFGLFTLYRATNKWWKNALIAIVSGVIIHVLFVELMNIPM